jgi:hypothetical protein
VNEEKTHWWPEMIMLLRFSMFLCFSSSLLVELVFDFYFFGVSFSSWFSWSSLLFYVLFR